jgi:hypothetical protein
MQLPNPVILLRWSKANLALFYRWNFFLLILSSISR